MNVRILLNGAVAQDQPTGIDDIREELFFSDEAKGYIYQIEGELVFHGETFRMLRAAFERNYCDEIKVEGQYSYDGGSWTSFFRGLIKLADIQWDHIQNKASCPIVDDSYLSKIDNNKNITFDLLQPYSKNGVDVSQYTKMTARLNMFSIISGRYFDQEHVETKTSPPWNIGEEGQIIDFRIPPRSAMFIYDALAKLIAMMTDDEVGFASDFFTYDLSTPLSYNEEAFCMLVRGKDLTQGTSILPSISFANLFADLHSLFNVAFTVERVNNRPVIRVEPISYFRQTNSNIILTATDSVRESVDLDRLYSKIIVGCSQNDKSPFVDVPLILHAQEEYGLQGTCNIDNQLDLRLKALICSSNAINMALPGISSLRPGGSVIRKYTTDAVTAPGFIITDGQAEFLLHEVYGKFILQNTRTRELTYIVGVIANDIIKIKDAILPIAGSGIFKFYEIFKEQEDFPYDDDTFIVQLARSTVTPDGGPPLNAAKFPVAISGLVAYNPILANYQVINRHLGGLPAGIINQYSDGNDVFNSENTLSYSLDDSNIGTQIFVVSDPLYRRITFDDDFTAPTFFDPNGRYDNTTGVYTVVQPGYYRADCDIQIRNNYGSAAIYQVEIVRVNASGIGIEVEAGQALLGNAGQTNITLSRTFACDTGDTLEIWVKQLFDINAIPKAYIPFSVAGDGVFISDDSTFGVSAVFNGGGLSPTPTNDVELYRTDINSSLPYATFSTIKNTAFDTYTVNYGSNKFFNGYLNRITRSVLSGEAEVTTYYSRPID